LYYNCNIVLILVICLISWSSGGGEFFHASDLSYLFPPSLYQLLYPSIILSATLTLLPSISRLIPLSAVLSLYPPSQLPYPSTPPPISYFVPPSFFLFVGAPPWSSGSMLDHITTTCVRIPVWAYLKVVSSLTSLHYWAHLAYQVYKSGLKTSTIVIFLFVYSISLYYIYGDHNCLLFLIQFVSDEIFFYLLWYWEVILLLSYFR